MSTESTESVQCEFKPGDIVAGYNFYGDWDFGEVTDVVSPSEVIVTWWNAHQVGVPSSTEHMIHHDPQVVMEVKIFV